MMSPLLQNKYHHMPSVFVVDNMLREARRQKGLPVLDVPEVCLLDPDGDMVAQLTTAGEARSHPGWACYHTRMVTFERAGITFGMVPNVVGAPFAVLVADELFASGCKLVISMTSAGQIVAVGPTPYFVLIERALRDEGTSLHYLPQSDYAHLNPNLLALFDGVHSAGRSRLISGSTWTTDAPFRETAQAIEYARSQQILGVEMEAAGLYAYAEATGHAVICLAHITNQMAQVAGDFEKGADQGSHAALAVISDIAARYLQSRSASTCSIS